MDLELELRSDCNLVNQAQIEWLLAQGVSPVSMIRLGGPACYRIRVDRDRFEPDPEGQPAFVFPEWSQGEIIDLIAWDGKRLIPRTGRCMILGFDRLEGWCDHLVPLRVFKDPVTWMVDRMNGIVIINEDAAWRILWWFEDFLADSRQHGEELRRLLNPKPRLITIQSVSRKRAA